MDSILLQKQVKDNSEELRNYLKDLSNWEDEMKRKESSVDKKPKDKDTSSKKLKKSNDSNNKQDGKKPQRIRSYDYKAWDNFDVDAECEKLDKTDNDGNKSESPEESSDSDFDPSEEYQQRLRDEATYEKERGNQFVKQQKWSEAIACYTHAIACYPKDPIYFANRALCYLKKDDLHSAEADCTSALQFDPNYVKALQRRAAARIGLKQYKEALDDLKKVLQLEPNNKESKKELERVEKILENKQNPKSPENVLKYIPPSDDKPKISKLAPEKIQPKITADNKIEQKPLEKVPEIKIPWPVRPNSKPIKTIQKLPHQRSKTPLQRITVTEITELPKKIEIVEKPSSSGLQKVNRPDLVADIPKIIRKDSSEKNINEKVQLELEKSNSKPSIQILDSQKDKTLSQESTPELETINFITPKSSVQFLKSWKLFKSDVTLKFEYLRNIAPENIPKIFLEAMESDIFEDILRVLEEKFIENDLDVFEYLKNLSCVKRFGTLVMFMSSNDKKILEKLFEYCKTKNIPEDEIEVLTKKYEL